MQMPAGIRQRFGSITQAILIIAFLAGLYLVSRGNYLLFHGIVEITSIAVAFAIFLIIWNTRKHLPDAFYLVIGISFLFIGTIDLVHMLAFRGMNVFTPDSSNIPTQIWIAGRFLQGIAFFTATLFIGRSITRDGKYDPAVILAAWIAAGTLVFSSIFLWQNFPVCYIEGVGLTPFKIASEFIISVILVATIVVLYLKRRHFAPEVWHFLVGAQIFLIFSELALASYASVYGFMNMLGHLLRLLSVYLFYRAFVVISLMEPYDILLRSLKSNEHDLKERLKELKCLASISVLIDLPGISLSGIMEKTVQLIPSAMQHGDTARARIGVDGQTYQTDGFRITPWMLSQEIRVSGMPVGQIEVSYLEKRPSDSEWPFLPEELYLVNAIAERLGLVIERDRAQKALVASERRYRSFVQSFRGIAYLATADWVPVFFHGAVEEITGYTEEHFIAGNPRWDQVIYPDDLALIRERDNPRLLHEPGFSTLREYRITRKDGEVRWLSDFIQNLTDESGHLFLAGVLTDITERKRVEQALQESENQYRAIVENIQDMIYRTDMNGIFTMVSPSGARLVGLKSADELVGRPVTDLYANPDDRKTFLNALDKSGSVENYPVTMKSADGTIRHVTVNSHYYHDPKGRVQGVEGIIHDITDLRRAEEALRMVNRKLNLLSSITRHDIKNQLLVLNGYISLSVKSVDKPEDLMNFFAKEAQVAEAIDRQISFTKDYEDLGVKSPAWQDAGAVAAGAAASLSLQDIRFRPDLPPVEIFADPLLAKVFYNLVDNSLHYGGPGMTEIRISARQEGDQLKIVYEDDGAGISLKDKERLFTKGFGRHTGLGLFLSREILGITGITITEEGVPGAGVRFIITVPKGAFRPTGTH